MKDNKNTRRTFLYGLVSSGFLMLGASSLLTACQSGKKTNSSEENSDVGFGGDCADYAKLAAEDLNKRKQLGYERKSPVPEQECHNCNLWLPPKKRQTCGGCTLFKGPIDPQGTCTYWSPRQS